MNEGREASGENEFVSVCVIHRRILSFYRDQICLAKRINLAKVNQVIFLTLKNCKFN